MPLVRFASAVRRHVDCPDANVDGTTVGEALNAYFTDRPQVRGYVLDERGAVRKHVNVFVDSAQVADRTELSDPVSATSEIDVFQALSGGCG